ncbi:MAG: helix-turn-helix domain-containing protein [Eubacterium sp.]|nr:helix-turn-helix domain-containing protein [Eubacterium sp.]
MDIHEAVKQRIAQLCEENNLSVSRLATISGVPHTTIKSIMYNQSKNTGVATIKKICDGINITIAEFFDTEVFNNLEQEIK